jgi:mono/diheme cytochrome c family protein
VKAAVATALALSCCFAACSKGAPTGSRSASNPTPAPAVRNNPASASDGARVYVTNCSSCHQLDGRGVSGAFPPLADNSIVTGNPQTVIAVVKFGMRGNVRVNAQAYGGTMPPWEQLISDDDIAAVVTYIRTAWRNRASPVSLADVEAVNR